MESLSSAETLTHSLWLVENRLIDRRGEGLGTIPAIRVRLDALGLPDERAFLRAVDHLEAAEPRLEKVVDGLCERLFVLRRGLPDLRPDPLSRRVARLVDPDALACLHPGLSLARDEEYNWAAVPFYHDGPSVEILREGSVDTHIHLGGAVPPTFYWLALMSGQLPLERLPNLERGHSELSAWQRAVLEAIRLRMTLAERVSAVASAHDVEPFSHLRDLGRLDFAAVGNLWEAREAVLDLTRGRRFDQKQDWAFIDPLRPSARWRRRRVHWAAGERRLLILTMRVVRSGRIRSSILDHDHLEYDFLKYLRLRNAFHQVLAYERGTEGLARFVETFGRRGFLFGRGRIRSHAKRQRRRRRIALALERDRMIAALDAQLASPFEQSFQTSKRDPLRQIEMRVSLPTGTLALPTFRSWMEGIKHHVHQGRTCRRSQVGLVIHLIKKGRGAADAEHASSEVSRLGHLLASHPGLRRMVVGIDAAGDERLSPPRVFAPAFHLLGEMEANHRPRRSEPPLELGRTFHVGEDVDDLLTGLRHIHEVVEHLFGRAGGRLGHALALGWDAGEFYTRRERETEPFLWSHLLDLVWAWGILSDLGEPKHLSWLERQVGKLCDAGLKEMRDCLAAMRPTSYRTPRREEELIKRLVPGPVPPQDKPVTIQADDEWIDLVDTLQKWLRERLRTQRVCIESNPTSNLLVGGFVSYEDLPYGRFVAEGLAVSLNTDDPGIFVTSLPGEFTAMYEALLPGLGHRATLQWLADRLFDARQSTFLNLQVPAGEDWRRRHFIRELMKVQM